MKRILTLIGTFGLFQPHLPIAAELSPVPRLTGQEFVERFFNGTELPRSQQSTKMLIDHETALGYLAGVADTTRGTAWCDKGRVKTTEIDSELAHSLRKLPTETLQQSAAPLIVDLLRKRYPCN